MGFYERIASQPGGERGLAAARLRYRTLSLLQAAAAQADPAKLSRRIKKAIHGDGDVSVSALAEMLHDLGYEVEMTLVPAGEPRRKQVLTEE